MGKIEQWVPNLADWTNNVESILKMQLWVSSSGNPKAMALECALGAVFFKKLGSWDDSAAWSADTGGESILSPASHYCRTDLVAYLL